MSRVAVDPCRPNIESLLAVEREVVVEPDEVRERAIRRARAALPRNPRVRLVSCSAGPRRIRVGRVAAAAVMLSALCALAFYAGYRAKTQNPEEPVRAAAALKSVTVPPVSAVPAATSLPAKAPPAASTSRPAKPKPVGSAKSFTETEAYAMELGVLQPAQQAVARQDFASALAAIAEHRRRFPSGRLAEEREALRVKALLGLGRAAEAQRTGAAFRERFPRSALHGRIDEMLETQK